MDLTQIIEPVDNKDKKMSVPVHATRVFWLSILHLHKGCHRKPALINEIKTTISQKTPERVHCHSLDFWVKMGN